MIPGYGTFAQAYNTTLGLRAGTDIGVSVVQRIGKKITIEGLYRDAVLDDTRNADLLLKRHFNALTRRINLFTGLGIGYIDKLNADRESIQNAFSMPLILGAEIVLINLHIGLDFQPSFAFNEIDGRRLLPSAAFSIRYILVPRKNKKIDNFFDSIKSKIKNQ